MCELTVSKPSSLQIKRSISNFLWLSRCRLYSKMSALGERASTLNAAFPCSVTWCQAVACLLRSLTWTGVIFQPAGLPLITCAVLTCRHGAAIHGVFPGDLRPLREAVHLGSEGVRHGKEGSWRVQDHRRVSGAATYTGGVTEGEPEDPGEHLPLSRVYARYARTHTHGQTEYTYTYS